MKPDKTTLLEIIGRKDKRSLLSIRREDLDEEMLRSLVSFSPRTYTTIAHLMAELGYPFSPDQDGNILRLRDYLGLTVAHAMVRGGYRFDLKRHMDILQLANPVGWTVAHEMAREGYKFDPDKHVDVLRLADSRGWTVAHQMARAGCCFKPENFVFVPEKHKEILLLKTDKGVSVAHVLAERGFAFDPAKDRDICDLKDNKGKSVIDYFLENNKRDILSGFLNNVLFHLSVKGLEEYVNRAKLHRMKKLYAWLENFYRVRKLHQGIRDQTDDIGLKL